KSIFLKEIEEIFNASIENLPEGCREVFILSRNQGLSNKEIAARMQVTPRTVNFHLDNIYSKLNVTSRTEAVMAALRYELVK
ncbi:MAG: winged helix-turn-helix transcriptional regulator, partial [Anaerolineae bacterium]